MSENDKLDEVGGNPEGLSLLANTTRLPLDRIEYHANADASIQADMECGILFIIAFWSGPARQAFHELTDVLIQFDPDSELRLVVVDIDGASGLGNLPSFEDRLSGGGETAWIIGGKIELITSYGSSRESLVANVKKLLAAPR